MNTYATRFECINREIIDPLEAGSVINAHIEYDVDAIAEECVGFDETTATFSCTVDSFEFWNIAKKYQYESSE